MLVFRIIPMNCLLLKFHFSEIENANFQHGKFHLSDGLKTIY